MIWIYCLVQFNDNPSFQISQRSDTQADWIEQNLYGRHLESAFYSNEWKQKKQSVDRDKTTNNARVQ